MSKDNDVIESLDELSDIDSYKLELSIIRTTYLKHSHAYNSEELTAMYQRMNVLKDHINDLEKELDK